VKMKKEKKKRVIWLLAVRDASSYYDGAHDRMHVDIISCEEKIEREREREDRERERERGRERG